ncbi:MAG: glycoside hydrolase family 71/99-like protein [Pirellulaceae bacterium]
MIRSLLVSFALCMATVLCVSQSPAQVVDRTSLNEKVMCGYQGWFNCPGDDADLGWTHWAKNSRKPFAMGNVTVDLWPDMSQYDADERFATGFQNADGTAAEVFSSANRKTVIRHFKWMQDYAIDGAFVQRFANGLKNPQDLKHKNNVLAAAREGSNLHGRTFAVMYDLSGIRSGGLDTVQQDWLSLQKESPVASDDAYLHHDGQPVVAIWGIGFNDGRQYSLAQCLQLVNWFKAQGCTVMVGVPSFWRDRQRDALDDPLLHQILKRADIVSPWSVGRYQTPKQARQHAQQVWAADRKWCEQFELDFLPVVFPGFSWHNMKGDKLDAVPRLKGEFLWSQIVGAKRAGCNMIYVAMFDEVDEATAIFKCTNNPPVGDGVSFLDYEGLPSDYYLRLVGHAGRLLRGEVKATDQLTIEPENLPDR